MLVMDTYKKMEIPEDYDLYIFEIEQIIEEVRNENGCLDIFNLIVLCFKIGFSFGGEHQKNRQEQRNKRKQKA